MATSNLDTVRADYAASEPNDDEAARHGRNRRPDPRDRDGRLHVGAPQADHLWRQTGADRPRSSKAESQGTASHAAASASASDGNTCSE